MTESDLVTKFQTMRRSAPAGHKTAHEQLYGTLFDRDIMEAGTNAARIAALAGPPNASAQIADGRKLAAYVTVKPDVAKVWKK